MGLWRRSDGFALPADENVEGTFRREGTADKHRIEIRNRRRKSGETLQTLHSDIRRLAALAFPMLDHEARETISCDYFLDALADPGFAFRVQERNPVDLDSALRIALQFEVWMKDVDRLRGEKRSDERKMREFTKSEPKSDQRIETAVKTNEALQKEVAEQRKKIAELEEQMAKSAVMKPPIEAKASETDRRSKNFACWGCEGVLSSTPSLFFLYNVNRYIYIYGSIGKHAFLSRETFENVFLALKSHLHTYSNQSWP